MVNNDYSKLGEFIYLLIYLFILNIELEGPLRYRATSLGFVFYFET